MSGKHRVDRREPRGKQAEVLRLIRRIQDLTLEVRSLRRQDRADPALRAKECELERLRWRLAVVARRAATGDIGAAA